MIRRSHDRLIFNTGISIPVKTVFILRQGPMFPSIVPWLAIPAYHPLDVSQDLQYIPRNMHTVFALLCFVVVIHWLIFPYPSGLLHWHCGNLTIAPVPAKQPWWIWINSSCEFIMKDCITTTKQSTTKPCAYFLGYTVAGIVPSFLLNLPVSLLVQRTSNIWFNFGNKTTTWNASYLILLIL